LGWETLSNTANGPKKQETAKTQEPKKRKIRSGGALASKLGDRKKLVLSAQEGKERRGSISKKKTTEEER